MEAMARELQNSEQEIEDQTEAEQQAHEEDRHEAAPRRQDHDEFMALPDLRDESSVPLLECPICFDKTTEHYNICAECHTAVCPSCLGDEVCHRCNDAFDQWEREHARSHGAASTSSTRPQLFMRDRIIRLDRGMKALDLATNEPILSRHERLKLQT